MQSCRDKPAFKQTVPSFKKSLIYHLIEKIGGNAVKMCVYRIFYFQMNPFNLLRKGLETKNEQVIGNCGSRLWRIFSVKTFQSLGFIFQTWLMAVLGIRIILPSRSGSYVNWYGAWIPFCLKSGTRF